MGFGISGKSKITLVVLFSTIVFLLFIASCVTTPKSETPQKLISENRYDEAKEMFVSRKLLDFQDDKGNTPLHAAAMTAGAEDMVSFLIELRADYTILNNAGNTALHEALICKNYKAAKLLAETGTALFIPDQKGQTPVDYVVNNKEDQTIVNSIISQKSGEIRDENGRTIVHYFAMNNMNNAISYCSQNSVQMSPADNDKKTPLIFAYEKADEETNLNEKYKSIETAAALVRAKCEPSDGIYSYFEKVIKRYNLNLRFNDNQTALHIAAEKEHYGIADYLLKNGAVTYNRSNPITCCSK